MLLSIRDDQSDCNDMGAIFKGQPGVYTEFQAS